MHLKIREQYESFLKEAAMQLSDSTIMPVDVDVLCNRLNVRISRSNPTHRGAILVRKRGMVEIQLPQRKRDKGKYSFFERFMITHELGHLLLEKKFDVTPLGRSEYWQHEDLCHLFARVVLMPDDFMKRKMLNTLCTPLQRLGLTISLNNLAMVPWPTSAFRVADFDDKIVFLGVKINPSDIEGQSFYVNFSTLPNRKERGRRLSMDSEIGKRFAELLNKGSRIVFDQKLIRDANVFKEFPSLREAKECAAVLASPNEIHVALQF